MIILYNHLPNIKNSVSSQQSADDRDILLFENIYIINQDDNIKYE